MSGPRTAAFGLLLLAWGPRAGAEGLCRWSGGLPGLCLPACLAYLILALPAGAACLLLTTWSPEDRMRWRLAAGAVMACATAALLVVLLPARASTTGPDAISVGLGHGVLAVGILAAYALARNVIRFAGRPRASGRTSGPGEGTDRGA